MAFNIDTKLAAAFSYPLRGQFPLLSAFSQIALAWKSTDGFAFLLLNSFI